jgi:hypothetical protein
MYGVTGRFVQNRTLKPLGQERGAKGTWRSERLPVGLPAIHKDPFDRMLIAQAIAAYVVIVSNEDLFNAYGVARLW